MNYLRVKYSQMLNILYIRFYRILACLVLVVVLWNIFLHVLMFTKTQLFLTFARFITNKQKVHDELFSFIHS